MAWRGMGVERRGRDPPVTCWGTFKAAAAGTGHRTMEGGRATA